ncbi:MAG: hypothetical protein KKB31_00005, partial [Nanoarchaeota archaeon]|nr:hypothetical protein [Nanoarchaeota archaeon]
CVFPSDSSCNPQEAECIGDKILKCNQVTISGKTGYQWGETAIDCFGGLKCLDDGLYSSCSCEEVNNCDLGEIKCRDSRSYLECSKDPNNPSVSCLDFRDLGSTVGEFEECVGDKIKERSDIGCAFNTPGSECSTQKDILGNLIEKCVNNKCVSITDELTASEFQFLNQQTRCYQNTIQKVSRYIGKETTSYRWEVKQDAQYSTLGTCNTGYLCIEYLSGQASCGLKAEFLGIITDEDYGIGKSINNVIITLTDKVPNRANMAVTARILDNGIEISGTRVNTFTDGGGKVTLNFNYAHPRSGELTIEVIANPSGVSYEGTKVIKVLPTLNLKLNCPIQGYLTKKVSCSWKIENIDTGYLVDADNLDIILNQGGKDLNYNPIGRTGLDFMAESLGSVLVKITANKKGFISDTEQINVPIESLTQAQSFKIDNVDYFTNNIVSTGTHQLTIEVKDNLGTPQNIQSVVGEVITPTGQIILLAFNKISEGNFKAIANFPISGQTYNLKGTIIFPDIIKENLLFEYQINTLGTATEKQQTNIIYLIIGGFVILLLIIFIIILALRKLR